MQKRTPESVKVLTIVIVTLATVASLLPRFHSAIRRETVQQMPKGFSGEVRVLDRASFPSGQKRTVASPPSLSDDGTRMLVVVGDGWLKLWERGLGDVRISPKDVRVSGRAMIAGDGSRVAFFGRPTKAQATDGATKTPESPSFLYLWEEGFSAKKVVPGEFRGNWHLSLSKRGEQIVCVPVDEEAKFSGLVSKIKDGKEGVEDKEVVTNNAIVVTLGSRLESKSGTRHSLPSADISVRVSMLEEKVVADSISLNDSKLMALNWRKGSKDADVTRLALIPGHTAYDIDDDGGADLLVFRWANELPIWRAYTLGGSDGPTAKVAASPGRMATWRVGDNSGVPVPGDYNGDGVLDLATFTPGYGTEWTDTLANWRIYFSRPPNAVANRTLVPTDGNLSISWGNSDAKAVPADYDGDGATDVAVFFPKGATWHLLYSSGGFNAAKATTSTPGFGAVIQWGLPGDIPMLGDYDGDGRADLAVWEAAKDENSLAVWKIRFAKEKEEDSKEPVFVKFGLKGDIPVQGDYNCDGATDIAVYRPSALTWIIKPIGEDEREIPWGVAGATPIVADFDADGCSDPAFFDTRVGVFRWQLLSSGFKTESMTYFPNQLNVVTRLTWGRADELPPQIWLRRHYRDK